MEQFDVIVVGAGVAGSAAAYRLSSQVKVLLLEQYPFLHARGSSHGGSRIFRHAYEDERYVKLALAADEAWKQLEQDSDDRLLYRTGGLDIGGAELGPIEAALTAVGRPFERLSSKEVGARFPAVRLKEGQEALFQPHAGVLAATRCLGAMQRVAAERGAVLRDRTPLERVDLHRDHVTLTTAGGRVAADRLVLSAGPWLSRLVPELEGSLHVEQQQVLYLRVEHGEHFARGKMPVFINHESGVYGLPPLEFPHAVKVSDHYGAPRIDLEHRPNTLMEARARHTIQRVRSFMPDVTDDLVSYEMCLYTKTPDEHFILDHHPEHPHVVLAGGFSGHGFKFGPVLGEILADLALEGSSRRDLSLFDAGRFAGFATQATA